MASVQGSKVAVHITVPTVFYREGLAKGIKPSRAATYGYRMLLEGRPDPVQMQARIETFAEELRKTQRTLWYIKDRVDDKLFREAEEHGVGSRRMIPRGTR